MLGTARVAVAGLAIAGGLGCGGTSYNGTAALSGAVTGTVSAMVIGSTATVNPGSWGLVITPPPNNNPGFFAGIEVPGAAMQTGTFTSANAHTSSSEVSFIDRSIVPTPPARLWAQTFDSGDPSKTAGAFTLSITEVGPSSTPGPVTYWQEMHGQLTVTLVPAAGNPASDSVEVTLNF